MNIQVLFWGLKMVYKINASCADKSDALLQHDSVSKNRKKIDKAASYFLLAPAMMAIIVVGVPNTQGLSDCPIEFKQCNVITCVGERRNCMEQIRGDQKSKGARTEREQRRS